MYCLLLAPSLSTQSLLSFIKVLGILSVFHQHLPGPLRAQWAGHCPPPTACALCPCTSGLPSADRHLLGPVIPWAFSQKALFSVLNFTIPSPLLLLPSTFHILTRWHSFFGLLWDPRSIFSEFLLPSPAWTSWEVALNWLYQYHSSLIPSSMSPAQNIPPP